MIAIIVKMHKSADEFAALFQKETKIFSEVPPSRYFKLLNIFTDRFEKTTNENDKSKKRLYKLD